MQQNIDFGSFPSDPNADQIRTAFQKVQQNFDQLFNNQAQQIQGVTSINSTPAPGITVNSPTGDVIITANIACVQVATTTLSVSRDFPTQDPAAQLTSLTQSSQVLYINLPNNVTGVTNIAITGTLVVGNANSNVTIDHTGNIVANRDIYARGNITAVGNVNSGNANLGNTATANYFVGNGSFLTGLPIQAANNIFNGNSNVSIPNPSGNIYINANAGTDYQWVLDTTGNFTLPDMGLLWNNGGLTTLQAGADGAQIGSNDGQSYVIANANGAWMQTVADTGNYLLHFDNTGNLSIPAIGAANLGNLVTANFGNFARDITANGNANITGNISANNVNAANLLANTVRANGNIYANNTISGNNLAIANKVDFTTTNNVALGAVANVHLTGGSNGQYLKTDGTGNLVWSTVGLSNLSNGNSNVSIPVANGNINLSAAGNANIVVITGTGVNVAGTTNLGPVSNVNISGGISGQFLRTNGTGGLTWANIPVASNLACGTSNISFVSQGGNINFAVGGTPNIVTMATTGVNVTGVLTVTGIISGNGNGLYSIPGSNITGPVANANFATLAATANTVAGANVTGTVANAAFATIAAIANTVAGANVTGTVANAAYANISGTSYSVDGANVNGTVANAAYANNSGNANIANIANVAYSVDGANVTGTVANAAHANIADSANLVAGANVTGQVPNALVASTVYTNAQPNITSVGTLTALTTTGDINIGGNANIAGNVLAGNGVGGNLTGAYSISANYFIGDGSNLTNVSVGSVANSNFASSAGTVTSSAQPNITSVGTLNYLIVSNNVTAGNVYANSGTVSANLLTGTLTTSSQPNITSLGNLDSLTILGNTSLGNVGNVSITGGTSGQYLQTDGAGNLNWVSPSEGTALINGTSNVNIPVTNGNVTTSVGGNANILVVTGSGINVAGTTTVTGNITTGSGNGGNISGANVISANFFRGDGSNITNITNVANANYASNSGYANAALNLVGAAQSNLTIANNLTNVGNITAGTWSAKFSAGLDGGNLSNINAANITGNVRTANTAITIVAASQPNLTTASNLFAVGNITTGTWSANLGVISAANLTNIPASNIVGSIGNATSALSIVNGNSNVRIPVTNGNVTTSVGGNANVFVVTSTGIVTTGGSVTSGDIVGNGNANISGNLTFTTALGGNIVGAYLTYSNYFRGDGSNLSNISGANVVGTVSTANYAAFAGNVINANQANITNIGILSNLTSTGTINFINARSVSLGRVNNLSITGGNPGQYLQTDGVGGLSWAQAPQPTALANGISNVTIPQLDGNVCISVAGDPNVLTVTPFGIVVAGTIKGSGANITDLPANSIVGTVATAAVANVVSASAQPNITSLGNLAALNMRGIANLGSVSNVTITGGFTGQYLQTDGNGNLSWVSSATGPSIVNGNSNVNIPTGGGNVTISAGGNSNILVATANGVIIANANISNLIAGSINASGTVNANTITGLITTANQPNITALGNLTALTVVGNTKLGAPGNVSITGGSNGQYLQTDGSGNLSWQYVAAGPGIANGNSNVFVVGSGGNVVTSVGGTANVLVISNTGALLTGSANITSNLFLGGSLNVNAGGSFSGSLSVNRDISTGGNLGTGQSLSVGLNLGVLGNARVGGTASVTGNLSVTGNSYFTGNVIGDGIRANYFFGDGSNLTGIILNTANFAGNVTGNAQPNITSVGNLTGLTVTGVSNLGNVGNVKITGGNSGFYLSTDGAGNLNWVNSAGGPTILNGNSNVNIPVTDGNITMSVGSNANVLVVTNTGIVASNANITGNITAANANLGNVVTANYFLGAVATHEQPNITLVGTLSNLTVQGITTLGSVSNVKIAGGNVGQVLLTDGAGNLSWSSSPAVTQLLNGNSNVIIPSAGSNVAISAGGNANVLVVGPNGATVIGLFNASNYAGNGAGLANVTGANVTGQVSNSRFAGTVYTNAQPNITSLGILSSLTVQGSANLGAVANLTITGGLSGQVLTTGGAGSLSWANAPSSTNISNGTSNVSIPATNGNINSSVGGNANVFVVTGTGVNVAGYMTATANANIGGNINMTANGNIGGANFVIANAFKSNGGLVDFSTGNSNVQLGNVANVHIKGGLANQYLQTDGNGNLSWSNVAGGNVTTIASGNSNVSIPVANGNITLSAVGNANILVVTGVGVNVAGNMTIGGGTGANISGANVISANILNVSGNMTIGAGSGANITGANVISANTFTAAGYILRSVTTGITATGTVQANAYQTITEINIFTTVPSGSGGKLPVAQAGMIIYITNAGANSLAVYPNTGAAIYPGAANAAYTLTANTTHQFIAATATQWYVA